MKDFRKTVLIILTIFFMGVTMTCANGKKDNCIIFWDYNPDLSLEYLESTSYTDCVKEFHEYIKIDFSEIDKFDEDTQVFTLKEDFKKASFGHQYYASKDGKLFVSIVVDGKIILNAVNGFVFLFLTPSDKIPNEVENMIYLHDEKYILISNKLYDVFIKRDTISKEIKKIISEKIK